MNAKLKKDRLFLLQAVFKYVQQGIDFSDINPYLDSDVGEVITDLTDKKRVRELKVIHKELKKWIEEWKDDRKTAHPQAA